VDFMVKRTLLLIACSAAILGCLVWSGLRSTHGADAAQSDLKPLLRRPVAMVLIGDGKWLLTANQRSGSVSILDLTAGRTVGEVSVGGKLTDLATTADGLQFLALDEEAGELVVLRFGHAELKPIRRIKVSPTPVNIQVSANGDRAVVASLWTRQLSLVDLGPAPRVIKTIDLPFAPRMQLLLPGDKKAIVADSFGGQLAVVDVDRGAVESVRTLPAHNIRGLALSADGKRLLVAHQILNPLAHTTFDDIHWGNLLTNNVRALSLTDVLDPKADLLRGSVLYHLGDVNHGTGDPAGIVVGANGRMIVTLAGVNEIAVGNEGGDGWQNVAVGGRPTAVLLTSNGQRAYVANTFADSVSVVDLKAGKVAATIFLGPQPELTPSDRGEMLFHDARLAHDGWLSCQSCHTDGHSNGRLADTLGDGTYGTPKRVLSLLGVRDTGPWAWNGSVPELETQVRKSIETTMRGKPPSAHHVRDLTAYLKTLSPPPSRDRLRGKLDGGAVRRGREVFAKHACADCHTPPLYTSAKTYDVGLADEAGLNAFNPPSLRGAGQGGPYFHDGRAATLAEVFTRHRHQLQGDLPKQDVDDLLHFLGSL
jgi:YVTN family beta-propeller protein